MERALSAGMTNAKIDRELIADKIDQLVNMTSDHGASIPVRFGFLLGELQGLAISLRHGGEGIGDPEERRSIMDKEISNARR